MLLTTTEIVFLSGLGFFFLLQILYFTVYLWRPVRYYNRLKKGAITPGSATPGVSVIICAQNESENLEKYLPSVLEQDYPQYEVIVVNEGMSEESDAVLRDLETKYKHLYHTYIPSEAKLSKKKLAITIGIKAAKYDSLLFTEAHCEPASKNWIRLMARNFEKDVSIVIGHGAILNNGGFIGKLSVFDSLIDSLQGLSIALRKKAYVATGRNLAYTKSLFMQGKGFQKHLNLRTGEDDLFVNDETTKTNTRVELSPESITWMNDCDFRTWKEMKVKRITSRKRYKRKPIGVWALDNVSRFGFWSFAIACIAVYIPQIIIPSVAGAVILLRWCMQSIMLNKAAKILQGNEKFYWSVPVMDLMQPLFNLYFRIYHVFRGKSDYTWKV